MKPEAMNNIMRKIIVDKITLNIGAGTEAENVDKAAALLKAISGGAKVVKTVCMKRIATWKLRPGLPVGAMVTLRGKKAEALLKQVLQAVSFEIMPKSFMENGFSFGIKEYIDIPGVRYDPKIGILGLDVTVSLKRAGFRVKTRKIRKARIGPAQRISAKDAQAWAQETLGVKMKEVEERL